MTCPNCGSENVCVQAIGVTKTKRKGCLYWLIFGWWLQPLLWIFFTLPMLLIKLFAHKKITTKTETIAVCQDCGNRWNV